MVHLFRLIDGLINISEEGPPVSSVQVCGSNSHRHFACSQSEVGDIINPRGAENNSSFWSARPPSSPPPSLCRAGTEVQTAATADRSYATNQSSGPLFVSVSNKSKQKPAGLSGRVRHSQCPKCMCVFFCFLFFLLWYVLCRKTALLNLCARTKQSHPWTYSGAGFLGLSAVK